MTSTLSPTGFQTATFEGFLARRQEPAWLVEHRRAAWQTFLETPLPDRRLEEWRRTDIRTLKFDHFSLPGEASLVTEDLPTGLLGHNVDLAGHTLAVNSVPVSSHLDPAYAAQGVLFGSLDKLLIDHAELLRPYFFTRAVDYHVDKLAALHAAVWSGGTVLYVPKGVKLDRPLHALTTMSNGGSDFSHLLVILEEGAEATLLTETASPQGTPGLHCGASEIFVGRGAKLRYVSLQNWGHSVWHFAHQHALVDADANLQWTVGALGSRISKVNQHVSLVGERAKAQVNGVMFTEDRQHLAYHTLQHHQQPHGTSDLLYKGALQDHAALVWRGMIKVDQDAQRTDGYQRNDNLMLSSTARANSIPGLEIEADDVRCTHGSTTGRVEEESVFYAQCRGLTRREATRMIVAGFFQQVFDRITIDSVREALAEAIGQRIREF